MSASSTSFSGIIPGNYDRFLGPWLFDPYAIDLVHRIPDVNAGQVLELACGTGCVTRWLAGVCSDTTQIKATDLNEDMLRIAKEKVGNKNIGWSVADMQAIPFTDQSFDLVVCQFGLMFVPDKGKAFSEIFRVLKKGGLLLFNVWDSLEENPAFLLADKVVNSYFPTDPVPFYQVPFSFHDPQWIMKCMTDAGFSAPKLEKVQKTGVCESVDDAVSGMIEGNPAYRFICDRNVSWIPAIKEKLRKELAERFGDHPMKAPMQAWVGEARR